MIKRNKIKKSKKTKKIKIKRKIKRRKIKRKRKIIKRSKINKNILLRYAKYGLITMQDLFIKKEEFTIWLVEVKKINIESISHS